MAFCPHCGKPATPGATFCSACGTSLPVAPPAAAPPAAPAATPAAALPLTPTPGPLARPVGVTIIGIATVVLSGLAALGLLIGALFFMIGGAWVGAFFTGEFEWIAALGGVFVLLALLGILVGLAFVGLGIATGLGVLTGKSWAWVVTLVFMGLNALRGLGELASRDVTGIVTILVSGLVIWYFFQPEVKRWFGRE